jgi:hypothetical protein
MNKSRPLTIPFFTETSMETRQKILLFKEIVKENPTGTFSALNSVDISLFPWILCTNVLATLLQKHKHQLQKFGDLLIDDLLGFMKGYSERLPKKVLHNMASIIVEVCSTKRHVQSNRLGGIVEQLLDGLTQPLLQLTTVDRDGNFFALT